MRAIIRVPSPSSVTKRFTRGQFIHPAFCVASRLTSKTTRSLLGLQFWFQLGEPDHLSILHLSIFVCADWPSSLHITPDSVSVYSQFKVPFSIAQCNCEMWDTGIHLVVPSQMLHAG